MNNLIYKYRNKIILIVILSIIAIALSVGLALLIYNDDKKAQKNIENDIKENIIDIAEINDDIDVTSFVDSDLAENSYEDETAEASDASNDLTQNNYSQLASLETLQSVVDMDELQEFACQYYVDSENEKRAAEWGENNYIPVERKLCEPVGYIWDRFGIDGKLMCNNLIVVIPTLEIVAPYADGLVHKVVLYLGFCRAEDITVSDGKANIEFTNTQMHEVATFSQHTDLLKAFPGYDSVSIFDPVFEELIKTRTPRTLLEEVIQAPQEACYEEFGIIPHESIAYALEGEIADSVFRQFNDAAYFCRYCTNTDNCVYEFINKTLLPSEYEEVCVKVLISKQHWVEESLKPEPEVIDEPADGKFVY